MKTFNRIIAAAVCSLPLLAVAQTGGPAVVPADQPRSNLEKQQTTQSGQATKYGTQGADTGAATTSSGGMNHGGAMGSDGTTGKTKAKGKSGSMSHSTPGSTSGTTGGAAPGAGGETPTK